MNKEKQVSPLERRVAHILGLSASALSGTLRGMKDEMVRRR